MRRYYYISLTLFWINILFASAVRKDICEQCVKIEECPSFAHLNKHEQQVWLEQVPCEGQQAIEATTIFGFSPVAKGDYVCCPKSNIWENKDNNGGFSLIAENINKTANKSNIIRPNNTGKRENLQQLYQNQYPGQDYNSNIYEPNNPNYQNQVYDNRNPYGQNHGQNYGQNGQNNLYGRNPNYAQYPSDGNVWSDPRQPGVMTVNPGQNQNAWQNPNGYPQQQPQQRNPYYNNGNGNGNSFSRPNSGNQCAAQTILPDPQTQCCGRDMSNTATITDLQNLLNIYAPSDHQSWPSQNRPHRQPHQTRPLYPQRQKLSENNTEVEINLDDRIAGGKETELDQFPWTVLLKMTFKRGNKMSVFNCGGSLISRRYVLTAGHCVFEQGAVLTGINVTLAEYDKRTFPRDCKYDLGRKPKCIDNVLMFAEEVILHPQYDDEQLHNDIALVRLQGYAPYTRFIRPICLPPINIDNDDLSNLPLAVAGWGRNGKYVSPIKQSTVVHLVPHDQCQEAYRYLSNSHLCAAGRTGEDTCKGDSGGPLMMLFRESYYVIGVVSGKRADTPCGSSVPSLYTNVYLYVPWIKSNIKN
ncbi:CLIP domain-containing serine protease 14D-like [Pararge aegeria]|uniref:CLIP domain-containing serine protease 14D-like n=1 Tax=Pararge aegeria TaxID=116150 RepID=UPI0019D2CC71|nr:CLIP domain-containing serine protease 14D-like [Pararge aegeria]